MKKVYLYEDEDWHVYLLPEERSYSEDNMPYGTRMVELTEEEYDEFMEQRRKAREYQHKLNSLYERGTEVGPEVKKEE